VNQVITLAALANESHLANPNFHESAARKGRLHSSFSSPRQLPSNPQVVVANCPLHFNRCKRKSFVCLEKGEGSTDYIKKNTTPLTTP
jgi:hypothetical protein